MTARILVAFDGAPSSQGALRLALNLCLRQRTSVSVLSVVEPASAADSDPGAPVSSDSATAIRVSNVREEMARRLAAIGPETARWGRLIEVGPPGPTIARAVARRRSSLVLLGLRGAQADSDHAGETTRAVLDTVDVPVLAVHPDSIGLPRRVLVAVDFDAPSLDAAYAVPPLLGGHASLHLAHVALETGRSRTGMVQQWERTYLTGAATRLEELARDLEGRGSFTVSTHVAEGDPEEKLLELAGRIDADLITVGSHAGSLQGDPWLSVALGLIRRAPCSVLAAPDAAGRREPRAEDDAVMLADL